ncbi:MULTISPECIES: hypothetical protein [Cytobacillus]|uniref:hypothetical protein n=1 Tax=Cytobacillus TaxID=2675230 RepID=UPI0020402A31|nr:hypothetical protein [Cytobacillus firmus]MCM3704342.1 hypothetical protein [Cytobacillus firmus]
MEKILNEILNTLKDHSKRFDGMDERFDSIDHEISDVKCRIGNVENSLENVENRLENVENSLENVENRLGNVENRLGNVENSLENVENRLGNVENRLGNVENRLGNVEISVERLSEQIVNNATEFRSHFKHIETKLDQHEETFNIISDSIKGTKIDIVHLSEKSGVQEMEINQLKKRIHS